MIVKQASVSSLQFDDNFFDIITAIQTHYFWPDLKNDVKEVYKVLKSKGEFALVSEIYKINCHMKEYKRLKNSKGYFSIAAFQMLMFLKLNKTYALLEENKHFSTCAIKPDISLL